MKKFILLLILILISNFNLSAQIIKTENLELFTNLDFYYAKYFSESDEWNDLLYINKWRNELVKLENASLTAKYKDDEIRSTISVQYGDIQYGYGINNGADYIREANFGFTPVKNLWIDGGYFFGELSTLKPLPNENFLTSLPIISYLDPLVNTGAKVSFKFNNNISGKFLVFSEYNNYSYFESDRKNFWYGAGISFDLNPELSLKINSLIGAEKFKHINFNGYNEDKITRFYSNLIIDYNIGTRFKNKFAFVYLFRNRTGYNKIKINLSNITSGFFLSSQFKINNNLRLSGRIEYMDDESGLMLANNFGYFNNYPVLIYGFTAGIEYKFRDKVYTRVEFDKKFYGDDTRILFSNRSNLSLLLMSMGIEF